jgi:hypothetical protein
MNYYNPRENHLRELSHLLRQPSSWPKDFVWNYGGFSTCAMGLAQKHWKQNLENGMLHFFDIDGKNATKIFCMLRPRNQYFISRFIPYVFFTHLVQASDVAGRHRCLFD